MSTREAEVARLVAAGDHSLERDGDPVVIDIPNSGRPQPPSVDSVVPIFRWDRHVENGVFTSVRKTVGVRVYLKRPWHTTGHNERLGVMAFGSFQSFNNYLQYTDARKQIERLVSQWGRDPLEAFGLFGFPLLYTDFPAATDVQPLQLQPDTSTPVVPCVRGTLGMFPPASAPFTLPAELLNGRIVVQEFQNGHLHVRGDDRSRVVYLETFDRDIVPIPTTNVDGPIEEI